MLSKHKVCIIPDKRIKPVDRLPLFEIMDGPIVHQEVIQNPKVIKRLKPKQELEDVTLIRTSCEFTHHINKIEQTKLKKLKDKSFFSPSLKVSKAGL